jgi:hypothetical protein
VTFDEWCQKAQEDVGEHQLTLLTSIAANLAIGRDSAALSVPTHYASEERMAALLERLGKPAAATFVRNKLPESKKIRSGDLGEILATEYVSEGTIYTIPIKRLRWKDHQNMSMRGDDLIAVRIPEDGTPIEFMKGETKSRATLTAAVLAEARTALDKDNGLPGFTSRLAAIKAVAETNATFEGYQGLRDWLNSQNVVALTQNGDWPTAETAEIWTAFIASFVPPDKAVWKDWTWSPRVTWEQGKTPQADAPIRVITSPDGTIDWVVSPDHEMLGRLTDRLNAGRKGLVKATVATDRVRLNVSYVGPEDLTSAQAAA